MSEYIKREDAERLLRYDFLSALNEDERVDELNRVPSADVVEVVRCKDCKHHEELLNNNDGNVVCWVHDIDVVVDRNGYCNCGERKEQEHGESKSM